jgi:hypothetical protein
MKKTILHIAAATLALTLSGCIAWKPASKEPVKSSGAKYSIVMPAGWNVLTLGPSQQVSKYGVGMQSLIIHYKKHKNAFGSGKNREDATADMDPRDLCNKLIADMKATPGRETMEITAVAPAMLGGRAGCRAEVTSKRTFNADGIRYQHLVYGVTNAHGVYILHYEAPVIHYFAKDLPDVEKSVATFKFL